METGRISPFGLWSEQLYSLVSFSKNVVTSSDTCSVAVTAATHLCQVRSIPASCNHTRHGLLAVIVQWTCSTNSFNTSGRRAVRTCSLPGRPTIDLVNGIAKELQARV